MKEYFWLPYGTAIIRQEHFIHIVCPAGWSFSWPYKTDRALIWYRLTRHEAKMNYRITR